MPPTQDTEGVHYNKEPSYKERSVRPRSPFLATAKNSTQNGKSRQFVLLSVHRTYPCSVYGFESASSEPREQVGNFENSVLVEVAARGHILS